MISVFQIYFDAKSEKGLESAFYPYKNEIDNDYFESHVMKQIYEMNPHMKESMDYIGVSSWKQSQKTHLMAQEIIQRIEKDMQEDNAKDVYLYTPVQGVDIHPDEHGILCGTIRQPNLWDAQNEIYIQIKKDNHLLNNSGILPFDIFDGKWQYCHCNYWIAKREVFEEYCKTVLMPALEFFERKEIKVLMPKWYRHSHTNKLYNSCAFTLEALFGSFLAHSNYTFTYLCKKKYRRKYQSIRIDGYEITNQ